MSFDPKWQEDRLTGKDTHDLVGAAEQIHVEACMYAGFCPG